MHWWLAGVVLSVVVSAWGQDPSALATPLVAGKQALATKDLVRAKRIFAAYLREHAADVQGELGLADAELGLREFEAAEVHYRHVVSVQPLLWEAHKNLVIVEAALGRWEDFDGERALLRAARERGAAGISTHDIDVVDVIHVRGQRWIVRYYVEPLGRTRVRYNFERFSADGKVVAYVSLESAAALKDELKGGAVVVGSSAKDAGGTGELALDWYDGKAHGTIARYAAEPEYERVRAKFLKWARSRRV